MDNDNCITISDEEMDENGPEADESVQVIGEVNTKQGSDVIGSVGRSDSSVIDLTDGNDYSFISSSQPPCAQTPYKSFLPSQPLTGASYSPPLFEDSPSSSPNLASPMSHGNISSSSSTSSMSARRTTSSSTTSHRSQQGNQTSPKKLTSKQEQKRIDRLKREELKKQRLQEKALEKVHKDANRANAASKALQNCQAIVDRNVLNLIDDPHEEHFRTIFESSGVLYEMVDDPEFINCITWDFKRFEVENNLCIERTKQTDLILNVMQGREYSRRILLYRDSPFEPESLYNYIRHLRNRSQAMIIILVYNLSAYLKAEKAKEAKEYQKRFKQRFETGEIVNDQTNDKKVSPSNTDFELLRLTLKQHLERDYPDMKLHIEFYEKTTDLVESIVRCTKSTASREITKKEQTTSSLDWAVSADKDKAIDPAKSLDDLTRLWIAQLQQFSQITLPIAKTIAAEYPSPGALIDQYQSLTVEEAQDLLAGLHVQRNLKRQVGPNISRRIYKFLTSEDPNLHIGYD